MASRYGIGEAAVLALRAGVDLLLLSHNTPAQDRAATDRVVHAVREALAEGRLTPEAVETALDRVRRFAGDR
ncbi:MAG: hypothetical protein HY725_19720 [Candidatus Rokubacteria bacterium]|nr:hypothetical protein [Candidatus Rokubacteria bacterium]